MRLVLAEQPCEAGTGGALWHARGLLHERFLLCRGDALLSTDLTQLFAAWAENGEESAGRMLLRAAANGSGSGVVETAGEQIVSIREQPELAGATLTYAGRYALTRSALDGIG